MNASAETLVAADLAEARGDFARLSGDQLRAVTRGLLKLHAGDEAGQIVVSAIINRTVRMPVYRWDDAVHAFDLLARKAEKRGLPVPLIEEISRETVDEGEHAEEWVTARILGAAPVLDGWRCVATLTRLVPHGDQDSARVLVHVADGEELDGRRAAATHNTGLGCDHCKLNRNRHLSFVLCHVDGREMVVGSTCLNEYMGTDALGAWFVWSRLHELTERVGGYDSWDLADHAEWLANHPEAITRKDAPQTVPIPLASFIAACVAEVREHGYVSRREAHRRWTENEEMVRMTGPKVWSAMQDATHVTPTADERVRAEAIIAWIDTLDRYDFDAHGDLRYTSSLAQSLDASEGDGVHDHHASILASAVTAYARVLAERGEWTNAYVPGKVGDGVVLDLTVRRSLGWAVACADAEGRQVLVRKRECRNGRALEVGDEIRVSASIGGQDRYQGVAQTFLSRPTVYRRDDELSASIRKKARAMFERLGQPVPEWAQSKRRRRRSAGDASAGPRAQE